MGEGIGALGDSITGALAASVIDRPSARRRADIEHGLCLNCGTLLAGNHCHRCGQSTHIHRSLSAFGHDLLHGILHFEGKTWRTLPMLAWRPGDLTRRYIHGERARFVSPLALFLFSVFFLFAVASIAPSEGSLNAAPEQIRTQMRGELAQFDRDIAVEEKRLAISVLNRRARDRSSRRIVTLREDRKEVAEALERLESGNPFAGIGPAPDDFAGVPILGDKIKKAQANPDLLLYKIRTNAYKYGWALIPLSLPFVWLVTIGPGMRAYRLYDHLVFTTYSIGFMMLMGIALSLVIIAGVSADSLFVIGLSYAFFHMYRQLRGAYRFSRASALIRAFLLAISSFIALTLFVLILVGLGLFG